MLNNFLNHTCDILETTVNIVSWQEVKTETVIYSWIPCHLYNQRWNLKDTASAENTALNNSRVLLESDKTLVKQGMKIIVSDPDLGELWTFQLDIIQMNRFNWPANDSIQLSLKSI